MIYLFCVLQGVFANEQAQPAPAPEAAPEVPAPAAPAPEAPAPAAPEITPGH